MGNSAFGVRDTSASESEQQAGTSTETYVSPGQQESHSSACKFWIRATTTGGITDSYNITSVVDSGAGKLAVTIATDFSSATYCIVAGIVGDEGFGKWAAIDATSTPTSGTFEMNVYSDASTVVDANFNMAYGFGEQ